MWRRWRKAWWADSAMGVSGVRRLWISLSVFYFCDSAQGLQAAMFLCSARFLLYIHMCIQLDLAHTEMHPKEKYSSSTWGRKKKLYIDATVCLGSFRSVFIAITLIFCLFCFSFSSSLIKLD